MKPEDFKAKTAEILSNLSDQAKVSTILAELTEDYDKEAVEKATVKSTAEKLTVDNEKLRQANMSLFLKVGEQKTNTEEKKQNEDTTPKFENLFDENGNLK
jgi:phage gp46-like protein